MVNKRGIIRILEAVVAIVIILGVLVIVSISRAPVKEIDLTSAIYPVLEEISKNATLRNYVLLENKTALHKFVSTKFESPLIFNLSICNPSVVCPLDSYPEKTTSVYAAERVISSNLTSYNPKKVKIFVWITT